ncbi:hypothetical protein OIU78_012093 [Salix suchowensis]|nr:hypothetical protein OIU78_012093 [Salix suchowensis]
MSFFLGPCRPPYKSFGSEGQINGSKGANIDNSGISSLKCPPIVAAELCRERLGVHPCDKRRTISENRSRFPTIDFSLIESDEDILWKTDARETDEEIAARGLGVYELAVDTTRERNCNSYSP